MSENCSIYKCTTFVATSFDISFTKKHIIHLKQLIKISLCSLLLIQSNVIQMNLFFFDIYMNNGSN